MPRLQSRQQLETDEKVTDRVSPVMARVGQLAGAVCADLRIVFGQHFATAIQAFEHFTSCAHWPDSARPTFFGTSAGRCSFAVVLLSIRDGRNNPVNELIARGLR